MNHEKLYKENVESVLLISTEHDKGTGFIVRKDGIVLTNHHVVYPSDEVLLENRKGEKCEGKVICSNRYLDLACIFPMNNNFRLKRPLPLGDASNINVGRPVIAIGHPTNSGNFSMTQGIVSATDNDEEILQLNISGNYGMSGGPVICKEGKVIGILTNLIYSGQERIEGISEALPINSIIPFLKTVPILSANIFDYYHYCPVCGCFAYNGEYYCRCGVTFDYEEK